MVTFVTVNWNNYQGRGAEYVNILFNSVARNLPDKHKYICFTDNADGINKDIEIRSLPKGLIGWWNKIYLFSPGLFDEGERIVYLDLDTLIVGALDDIIKYDGEFAMLRDYFNPDTYQSGVMMWRGGFGCDIWQSFVDASYPNIDGGDQVWIRNHVSKIDCLQELFPLLFVSYKVHCRVMFPKNSRIVCFHGQPRPHEVTDGWVPHVWKLGGGTALELIASLNVSENDLIENIRASCKLDYPRIKESSPHDGHAIIVGGGPSLKNDLEEIKWRHSSRQRIFATNNTYKFLLDSGIKPDYHVMLDARKENADFVPDSAACLYASQCHPEVFQKALDKGCDIKMWHSMIDGIQELIFEDSCFVGAGLSSVGLKAMALAYTMGYRNIHIYGMDSSYEGDEGHAYKQPLNNGERVIDVECGGKQYRCASWMATQAEEFKNLADVLLQLGCIVTVHGDGLLPDLARSMAEPLKYSDLKWPEGDAICIAAMQFAENDVLHVLEYCPKKGVAIQAGGNVGVWPIELSKQFLKVFTFEPDQKNFDCLLENTKNIRNIYPYKAALGEDIGESSISRVSNNCGASHISTGCDVKIITIDSLSLDSCDLIQLDVEGYELLALRGASKTIDRFHPTIVIEDNGLCERYGIGKQAAIEYLTSLGYKPRSYYGRDIIFTFTENKKGV